MIRKLIATALLLTVSPLLRADIAGAPAGSYIKNQSSYQTGAKFNISSGTVRTQLRVGDLIVTGSCTGCGSGGGGVGGGGTINTGAQYRLPYYSVTGSSTTLSSLANFAMNSGLTHLQIVNASGIGFLDSGGSEGAFIYNPYGSGVDYLAITGQTGVGIGVINSSVLGLAVEPSIVTSSFTATSSGTIANLNAPNLTFTTATMRTARIFDLNHSFYAGELAGNSAGQYQTCLGYGTCTGNTVGLADIGIGFGAGAGFLSATGGNIAMGSGALGTDSFRAHNIIALGTNAGASIGHGTATPNNSILLGQNAGKNVLSYGEVIAIGWNALTLNTSGFENVAVGIESLAVNTTGYNNVGLGNFSLTTNKWGVGNVGLGQNAGGSPAGPANQANPSNDTMTYLGTNSHVLSSTTYLQSGTALGYNAEVGCSNCVILGALTSNHVGIGTNTVTYNLDVIGSSGIFTNGGLRVTGGTGVNVTYGVTAGSMTVSNLTAGRCVETTTGGLLTVASGACGTGSGGGGGASGQVNSGAQFSFSYYSVAGSSNVLSADTTIYTDGAGYLRTAGLQIRGGNVLNLANATNSNNAILYNPGSTGVSSLRITASSGVAINQAPSSSYDLAVASFSASVSTSTTLWASDVNASRAAVAYGVTAGSVTAGVGLFNGPTQSTVTYGLSVGSLTVTGSTAYSISVIEGATSEFFPPESGRITFSASSSSHAFVSTFNGSLSTYTIVASSMAPVPGQAAYWVNSGPNSWILGSTAFPSGSGSGINLQSTLQSGATFYVSSGTVVSMSVGGTTANQPIVTNSNNLLASGQIQLSSDLYVSGILSDTHLPALNTSLTTVSSSFTVTGAGGLKVIYGAIIASGTFTSGVTAASGTFTGALMIPNGANPTVDAVGEVAFDTTDGALVAFNGVTANVVAVTTQCFSVNVSSGLGFNGLNEPIWTAPPDMAITLTKITAWSLPAGTTVVYQLDEAASAFDTAGTNVFSVPFSSANYTSVVTNSFSNAGIAAGASLVINCPAGSATGGTPRSIFLNICYKRDRE